MPTVERTCGMLVELSPARGATFCGQAARFRYVGLLPRPENGKPYAKVVAERGRNIIDMCLEHTREMLSRMEPALKERQVSIRSLEFDRVTLNCKTCWSLFRIEKQLPEVARTGFKFCPSCGSELIEWSVDPSLDYWEALSADLDLPVTLVHRIYSLWLSDPSATERFVEYVRTCLSEVIAAGG